MEEVDGKSNYRDKAKAPCVRKHRRVEAAYSSVSVMDDAAKDALSLMTPDTMLRHGWNRAWPIITDGESSVTSENVLTTNDEVFFMRG